MKNEVAIRLTKVSKKYYIHHEKPTLAERLLNGKDEEFYALKNINLTIKKGERIGIIGANGSGKTTLLKLITGIANPTKGKIETYGRVVSLIDLEAGFHPDLTGIQNIYLNGTLLGLSKKEIESKLSKIIEFADIGKFIDAPVFTYSSGMQLRLGFSVAVYSDPDVLILDENISVGDEDFSYKAKIKISEFIRLGKTIIFASHNMALIKELTTKVCWIGNSKAIKIGKSDKIIKMYLNAQ